MEHIKRNKNAFSGNIPETGAFTFVELLIAISIFSVIAISIYTAFNAGIFSWRQLNASSGDYQQLAVTLDLMADEIASYITSDKVKFEGSKDKITFFSRIRNNDKYNLAKVAFFFDSSAKSLMRSEENIKITTEELFPGIKALEFKYFCKKPGAENGYEWVDSFIPDEKSSCAAVSISIAAAKTLKRIVPLYVEVKGAPAA